MVASARLHLITRLFDGRDDLRVSRASAEITTHVFLNIGVGFRVTFFYARYRGHDLPGRAITALKAVLINERLLHRVKLAVDSGQSFDGFDVFAVRRHGKREAR